MTNSTEQSIDSADRSSRKGSVDELGDFFKQGNIKKAVEVLHFFEM